MDKSKSFSNILDPLAFVGVKKEDFKNQYRGKLPYDLDEVWEWIKANRNPKNKKKE